ncbi:hypothetical protein LG296_19585 (plasmid) [Ureibacillus chungkukjangi]|uniref:hypothetical protein n=1 Tax=Ureibacillus chungkukjangi TaxID=1202712 RepID=UPI000D368953|nr:hypothetical protein [Ureibacillus chungkukjangi]MCM3390216.1 hypothetical protein [Ureibacillus chungkukjangi]HCG4536035.1 hypothetical protein [Salmonella enterica subsp. enterica serovar Typhi str. AG3]
MSILLAIAQPIISNQLRKELVENGMEVLSVEVVHRKYLNETIELSSPSTVIIHDLYLPSELEEQEEQDKEILQMIEYWRSVYDNNLRIVYLCVRERHDPFIGQLVARNVLDIFHEQNLRIKPFIEQIQQPPRFINVQKYGTGNLNIEYIDEEKDESADRTEMDPVEEVPSVPKPTLSEKAAKLGSQLVEGAEGLKEKIPKRAPVEKKEKPQKEPRPPKPPKESKESSTNEMMMEDILDLLPVEIAHPTKSAVIGTVLIGIASVESHLGSTHTAQSVASYLKSLGNSVALIESNFSGDFDRIHALSEGERLLLKEKDNFELYGITHYKYRDNLNLNSLYSAYEYVVMDYGHIDDDTPYADEFMRAHVRCVVCSGDEWKFHWIESFFKRQRIEKDACTFVIPCGSDEKSRDLQERLNYQDVYYIPLQENAYKPLKETVDVLQDVLGTFVKSTQRTFSKKSMIATSVISVAVTTLIITIFSFLG